MTIRLDSILLMCRQPRALHVQFPVIISTTRKHSNKMRTDRAVTRPSSERVAMRPKVDRQTPVKTLPNLAVGNKSRHIMTSSQSLG